MIIILPLRDFLHCCEIFNFFFSTVFIKQCLFREVFCLLSLFLWLSPLFKCWRYHFCSRFINRFTTIFGFVRSFVDETEKTTEIFHALKSVFILFYFERLWNTNVVNSAAMMSFHIIVVCAVKYFSCCLKVHLKQVRRDDTENNNNTCKVVQ